MFRSLVQKTSLSALTRIRMISDKAGSIHEAGGQLGKKGSAEEEAYFRSVRAEQMAALKVMKQNAGLKFWGAN